MKEQKNFPLETMRHSTAHLLAAAIQELYPNTKFGVGPVVDFGFYYDIDAPQPISIEAFKTIEKKMEELKRKDLPFIREELSFEEAKKLFTKHGQTYKVQLIEDIETYGTTKIGDQEEGVLQNGEKNVSVYKTGDFVDLCRGPHVDSTRDIGVFTLKSVAGAYWRGDEKNPMLQRVYGYAFATKEELDAHVKMIEEAEKRDHKKLGTELEIFMFHHTSPGMAYWLPKGVVLYNELVEFWRKEHARRGYQEIVSPLLNKKELYIISGHYEHYWGDMFTCKTADDEEYGVKAMNCPNAMVVFGSKLHSYRDLPLRLSDTDALHRYERSGTLNGLLRVREFRQDDAHIYITEKQIASEYKEVFSIVERFYSIFGMSYTYRLGTRPESFMGDIETWNKAEDSLKNILNECGKTYTVLEGDGAFYGPKVDILMRDAIGREWQMGTIQLDFQQPRRFDLHYIAEDGSKKTPVVIHRVVYGSLERFIGILIEHFAGAFPTWIAPVQVCIASVGLAHIDPSKKLAELFQKEGIRVEMDTSNESVGYKIRKAEKAKIPYMIVIGDKEADLHHISVRVRGKKDVHVFAVSEYIEHMKKHIQERSLEL
jgi:threonyl-tRNA synthetase